MNKIAVFAAVVTATVSALAAPYWTLVTTDGANGDTSGDFTGYRAYFCTKAAAAEMFEGNDTIAAVTQYLTTDTATYKKGMGALAASGTALSPYVYDDGQYSFTKYLQSALGGEYLAVLAYSDASANPSAAVVRVFDAVADSMGSLTFAPSEGEGTAGEWTAIPEPTGGMLLLLGTALLALRRKQP